MRETKQHELLASLKDYNIKRTQEEKAEDVNISFFLSPV
jgi:hypothetical protein